MAKVTKAALKKMPKSLLKPPPRFKKLRKEDFLADMERLGEDIAEEFKEQLIENIESNAYGFKNAESTTQRKGSDIPLIDTHQMVDAIYREGTTVSVEDTPRDDSPLTNLELAMVHEYGVKDKGIPPRPVWRNTMRDMKPSARKHIETLFTTGKFKKR